MKIAQILGANEYCKSRLHNCRGELVTTGLLSAASDRARGRRVGPWIAPGAIRRLEELLRPDMSVLELGSGSSTAWFAERVGRVVSIEPNSKWASSTRLEVSHLANVELRTSTVEKAVEEIVESADLFDVILVDDTETATHTRTDSVRMLRDHARHILVLDDSDRRPYASCDDLMSAWRRERFTGFKARPLRPTETTIWIRETVPRLM